VRLLEDGDEALHIFWRQLRLGEHLLDLPAQAYPAHLCLVVLAHEAVEVCLIAGLGWHALGGLLVRGIDQHQALHVVRKLVVELPRVHPAGGPSDDDQVVVDLRDIQQLVQIQDHVGHDRGHVRRRAVAHARAVVIADPRDLRHPVVDFVPVDGRAAYTLLYEDGRAASSPAMDVHVTAVHLENPAGRWIGEIVEEFRHLLIGPAAAQRENR
jgi:hypothetical protein